MNKPQWNYSIEPFIRYSEGIKDCYKRIEEHLNKGNVMEVRRELITLLMEEIKPDYEFAIKEREKENES